MDKTIRDFTLGVSTTFEALGFIAKHRTWWYFLFPLAFNLLLFFSGIMAANWIWELIEPQFTELISGESIDLDEVVGLWPYILALIKNGAIYVAGAMKIMLVWTVKLMIWLLFGVFGGYVVLIVMSPALAYISEHTEKLETGHDYPLDWEQMARDVVRGVLLAIRNMFYQLGWTLLFMVLAFIPLVQIISPFGIFIVGAYYYGYSFMDYVNERRRLSIAQGNDIIKKRKGLAIGNGTMFSLTLMIPFVGATIGTFTAVLSTVGASLALVRESKKTGSADVVETS